ncbi:MAG: ATP-dependent Clp protease adaptor ClpS [Spirochaetales bacterium]|nr:ATP-dependent Clp protease adaptor ClpS [Spirochaetales bacterium]
MRSGPATLRENPAYSRTEVFPEKENELYAVVIIDNDHNTYQQVIDICMKALGCDFQHAFSIALAVDNNGEAEVLRAPLDEARRIASIIETIGIEVRLLPLLAG